MLKHIHAHIQTLQRELAEIDDYPLAAMQPYALAHGLLQTIPGIDEIGAAMILIEIGVTSDPQRPSEPCSRILDTTTGADYERPRS